MNGRINREHDGTPTAFAEGWPSGGVLQLQRSRQASSTQQPSQGAQGAGPGSCVPAVEEAARSFRRWLRRFDMGALIYIARAVRDSTAQTGVPAQPTFVARQWASGSAAWRVRGRWRRGRSARRAPARGRCSPRGRSPSALSAPSTAIRNPFTARLHRALDRPRLEGPDRSASGSRPPRTRSAALRYSTSEFSIQCVPYRSYYGPVSAIPQSAPTWQVWHEPGRARPAVILHRVVHSARPAVETSLEAKYCYCSVSA